MIQKDFIPKEYTGQLEEADFGWQSPSNIALIKYWGKKEIQIPANPSISFTLDNCHTKTWVQVSAKSQTENEFSFEILLDGAAKPDFAPKIETFFKRVQPYLPFVNAYHFKIRTTNSFPHSSGIASSASGMSALALCFMSMENTLIPDMDQEFFFKKASFLSRLGSGSACRSIEGPLMVFGQHQDISQSSNLYGVKYTGELHDNFKKYQDTVLLVDVGEKKVSSSVGHDLVNGHPFASARFEQAHKNLSELLVILKNGDLEAFVKVVESEALVLHAIMMSSQPYYLLLRPNTLRIIEKIWEYRANSSSNLCFTLDAGANVHLLYPEAEKESVLQFIKNELVVYCKNEQYICDQIGFGAKKL
ncbi:diphosphomevalonate/mevalonate 3,5-bisphosphate decarboxylase family protein [Galbibacter sp.]|uniref:diphosphomevalonate/mevalonate 3,5-bisphosphate decarboxylase family protein n=1 Tax=Galbibacter sp. TaxID=2918471 RepID=UPI003A938715